MTINVLPRPGVMDIDYYTPARPVINAAQKTIYLCSNESALGPSPLAEKAYIAALENLRRYPDGTNYLLRDALAEYFKLDAAGVLCASGSEDILRQIANTFIGPGDEAVYSQYGFMIYKIATIVAGGTPVEVAEKDYRIDVNAMLAAVTDRTKVVFVANPNNPTGTFVPCSEIKRLADNLPENVLLVIDGAYADFVEDRGDYQFGHELLERGNVVITRTFSKLYALAAVRLGWVVGRPDLIGALYRNQSAFPISSAAQRCGIAALQDRNHAARCLAHNREWLQVLQAELTAIGLTCTPSMGNFLLTHFPGGANQANHAHSHLLKDGISTRDMKPYKLPQCLRITVGLESENLALMDSLKAFMTIRSAQ